MTGSPEWTKRLDLASRAVGGTVMWATDELFAEKENLVNPWRPRHRPETFGPKGQVYDGWETRRHREPGDDQALVRLGLPGVVHGVVVDTAFFRGNYPPEVTVEACAAEGYPSAAELSGQDWDPIVPRSPVDGDAENHFAVDSPRRYTHVRLTMHPDGGVARLRVHGEVVPDPALLDLGALDLAALENGAECTGCSDMFYSAPRNMLLPGLAAHQAEGWETARRRDDGNDWAIVRLAGEGIVRFADLDTSNLRGNAPGWAALSGSLDGETWFELLPRTRLQPDTRHRFAVPERRAARHVRLDILPDGGMARLRLFGGLTDHGATHLRNRFATTTS
nr:allantoicase [Prauserella shujinwangii]